MNGHLDVVKLLFADSRVEALNERKNAIYYSDCTHTIITRSSYICSHLSSPQVSLPTLFSANRMESEDVLMQICSRLDDLSIRSLVQVCKSLSVITSFWNREYFYYLRAQYFLKHRLRSRKEVGWKQAYYSLLGGSRDNELVLSLELETDNLSPEHLRLAVLFGYTSLVEELLSYPGVDPSEDDNYAINTACKHGQIEIVRLLLADSRADPSDSLRIAITSLLVIAIPPEVRDYSSKMAYTGKHRAEIVRLLLADSRIDPRQYQSHIMILLLRNNQADILRVILEDGRVDPATDDNYAIRGVANSGSVEMMKLLLEDGRADPLAMHGYCLIAARSRGYEEIVELLLADKRIDNWTRLRYSSRQVIISLTIIAACINLRYEEKDILLVVLILSSYWNKASYRSRMRSSLLPLLVVLAACWTMLS